MAEKKGLSREERSEFVIKFFGSKFSLEQVVEFIRDKIVLDMDEIMENALKNKARSIIGSFKDQEGIRKIAAFNNAAAGEPRDMVYQAIETCYDTAVLDRQIQNIEKNIEGAAKTIRKTKARKEAVENQVDLLDLLGGLDQ